MKPFNTKPSRTTNRGQFLLAPHKGRNCVLILCPQYRQAKETKDQDFESETEDGGALSGKERQIRPPLRGTMCVWNAFFLTT